MSPVQVGFLFLYLIGHFLSHLIGHLMYDFFQLPILLLDFKFGNTSSDLLRLVSNNSFVSTDEIYYMKFCDFVLE